ncbi:efflux RND transporter permease subunit [Marinicellulosiphila megalodicopiae]|uniref:efflux RND transporter permease subunit n=1 Tax=Marinicellulosiphila megalodicopiae TaxID=2724896 RepID=UPI003BB176D6
MLSYFVRHRLAANILMVFMLVAGIIAMQKTPITLMPDVSVPYASLNVEYEGVSAEIIANDIVYPLTQSIKQSVGVESVKAYVSNGNLYLGVQFLLSAKMDKAVPDVQKIINQFDWPVGVDVPNIVQEVILEPVGLIILSVDGSLNSLREIALDAKQSLIASGLADVEIWGLSGTDIYWRPKLQTWMDLNQDPVQISQLLAGQISRSSAGISGRQSLMVGEVVEGGQNLSQLTIGQTPINLLHELEDLSAQDASLNVNGNPAVILNIVRSASMGTIESGQRIDKWVDAYKAQHGSVIYISSFSDTAKFVQGHLDLLTNNALFGLILVLLTLFILLNSRVAFWTAAGIPVAIFATLGLLYVIDGNLNIFSIFALLIALGIVVDDAIVISEETLTLKKSGMNAPDAAIHGVRRMFAPVMAAALTSIAAFSPLLFLPGAFGELLKPVPLVIICVLVASLFECFFVLPGHLNHSLAKSNNKKESKLRIKVDNAFSRLRDGIFRSFVQLVSQNRGVTILAACSLLLISFIMVKTDVVKFNPDMDVEFNNASLTVSFYDETTEQQQKDYAAYLIQTLKQVELDYPNLIKQHIYSQEIYNKKLEVYIELLDIDDRDQQWKNAQVMDYWKSLIKSNEIVKEIKSSEDAPEDRGGSNTSLISFQFQSNNLINLKAAVAQTKEKLNEVAYLTDVNDDFRSGSMELKVKANALARQLGMTDQYIMTQASKWLSPKKVVDLSRQESKSSFYVGVDRDESWGLEQINRLPITSLNGDIYTLEQLTEQSRQITINGFSINDGQISARVSARISDESLKVSDVSSALLQTIVNPIKTQFGLNAEISGGAKSVQELIDALMVAIPAALLLIFLILAWVFQSWLWPIAVVVAIPFSMTGAVFGHWLMGADFTFLSVLGLFGVAGIVVNDSIILIDRFRQLLEKGMDKIEAIVEASCQRFRAVLLTSVTTVIGLVPILFETSIQAQIVKTMAISLAFGLLYGTIVVLVITPCVVSFMRVKHITEASHCDK